jgi:PDZ domain-containing protein
VAAGAAAILGLIPTPYWILAPGHAVDLSESIAVDSHSPPADRFLLTDVLVQHATALALPMGLLPGNRLVREDDIVPRGIAPATYDRSLVVAMDDSQATAAIVAERAAGLRVPAPHSRFVVGAFVAGSRAHGVLRAGDQIVAVNGAAITELGQVRRLIDAAPPGEDVAIRALRDGSLVLLRVPTTPIGGKPRLGVEVEQRFDRPQLPVPVMYTLPNISGSSAGLMFALQIYRTLRGRHHQPGTSIAGTGTLALDGTVGPIEGTLQKLIAAKRAGASIFLVPRENFGEIRAERGVRIVPVMTFRDALAALPS